MKRVLERLRPVLFLGPLGLTHCADNQELLIIERVPAWTDAGGGQAACVADASSQVSLPRGQLDLSFKTGYLMPAVITNTQLEGMAAGMGIDIGEVDLQYAEVSLSLPQAPDIFEDIAATAAGGRSLVEFRWDLANDSLPPGDSLGIFIQAIPSATAVELSPRVTAEFGADAKVQVLAEVVVVARRSGTGLGTDLVESRDFHFPIDVCHHCLESCSECPDATCPAEGFSNGWFGGVCQNAQDLPVYPAACAGAGL